ncbi:hypothetical protein ABZ746_37575 [Streptomyces sp. NPDC020096]
MPLRLRWRVRVGCDCPGDGEWQPGECDNCFGEPVEGPLGTIYCACAIGQGAPEGECRCGPEEAS